MHIKRENETEKERERSVFSTVFLALVAVLAVEIAMLLLSFTLSGFPSRLNSNAEQILDKQVVNRAAYISGQLIEAQDLSDLDSAVNRAAAQLVQEGETVASLTSSNEKSTPLFDEVSGQMVRTLREKNVTGVYIVLHTGEISRTAGGSLPCLYLRDLDPSAPASVTNDDLLFEHAPAAVMRRMSISTSENWEPGIPVTGGAQDDFFRLPYDRAREDGGIQNAADYGRWSTESYTLAGDSRPVISYTQPLIYPDGTVYGVIGVELLTRYVQSLLPYSELQNDGFGAYLLARSPDTTQDSSMTLHRVVTSAADSDRSQSGVFAVDMQSESGGWTRFDGWRCYASVVPLSLYSRNAPFSEGSHWMLVGTVSTTRLFAFSRSAQEWLVITILLTVLVGLLGCLFSSRRLAGPITRLSDEVAASAKLAPGNLPRLSRTGIAELDRFAAAFTDLSRSIINTSTRFQRIIDMASVKLTGLYNRKAFNRTCERLFRAPSRLGHAALMMLDLDNLKALNDAYGHDTGDRYIRETGRTLHDAMTGNSVCSRLSGDEFMVLFYGYDSRAQLRRDLNSLQSRLRRASIVLPNGDSFAVSISGGVAWYPEDGNDMASLKKYADFAMYQVKRSHKGGMQEFDIGVYNEASYETQIAQEFEQMLAESRVTYHFQPIFDRNGEEAAYEALMRPEMPNLRSPGTVMRLAQETGRLYDIEKLTMFTVPEIFRLRQQSGLLAENAWLFVNSIASVCLIGADVEEMRRRVNGIGHNVVIEITEEEDLDLEILNMKRRSTVLSGLYALDDYGSGYSNEGNLITLDPDFIKIDISIIRGIESDPNKQEVVRNIVSYAHQRGMRIVAEGIETAAELRTSRALGADLFQGYFLSRPSAVPSAIAAPAQEILREFPNGAEEHRRDSGQNIQKEQRKLYERYC